MHRLLVIFVCAGSWLLGQAAPNQGAPTLDPSRQAPPSYPKIQDQDLYPAFFRHLLFLERTADDWDARGERGIELRSHYQEQIGLSEKEAAILKQVAKRCQEALGLEDKKVEAFRGTHTDVFAHAKAATPVEWEAIHNDARRLTEERDRAVILHIGLLKTLLYEAGFKKVDDYIHHEFISNVTVTPVAIPGVAGGGR